MMTPAIRRNIFIGILLGLAAGLFFYRLDRRDLWASHEARAAQDAQRMIDDHSWGLPRLFDDQFDFQKPPMYYWLAALAGEINGGHVDALTVRLPAAISATATILLIFFTMSRLGRPIAGFVAGAVLATAQHFTWMSRVARIDMPLTLAVTVAVIGIGMTHRWKWLGFVAIAVGVLLKGPVGFVLPLAVLLGDFVASRRVCPGGPSGLKTPTNPSDGCHACGFAWACLPLTCPGKAVGMAPESVPGDYAARPRDFLWGLPLVLLLAAPWFIWASIKTHGEFFRVFFIYHNVQRAMGGASALAVHPWWFYGPRFFVDAQPWSLLVGVAAIWLIRSGIWRRDRQARLGFIWLFAVVGVMSCAKFKRADYLLPAYPGLALLLGCAAERFWQSTRLPTRRIALAGLSATVAAVIGIWIYLVHVEMPRHEGEREQRTFAAAIRQHAPKPNVVLFFRAEAHLLAFHLERPINTFLEWENLDVWAGRPESHFVVMPLECAATWREHLKAGELEEVCRNTDFSGGKHEKPLVLMRTRTKTETTDAAPRQQASHRDFPDQRGHPGPESSGNSRNAGDGLDRLSENAQSPVRDSARR